MFDIRFFIDWINNEFEPKLRLGQIKGEYPDKFGNSVKALYGVSDMANVLYSINSLFPTHQERKVWVESLQSFQQKNTGYFRESMTSSSKSYATKQGHDILHNTAFAISAMNLFGARPEYPLKFADNFNTKDKLYKYLHSFDWENEVYRDSHKGAGFASCFALVPDTLDSEWFNWYFEICDSFFEKLNGMMGRNKPDHGDFDQIGGTFHYIFIYEYFRQPVPYPEQRINSVLSLQRDDGSWSLDQNIWWITLDAVYMLTRACIKTGYRKKDITEALKKTMKYVIERFKNPSIRKKDFEDRVHNLTAAINCIAEIQMFLGRNLVVTEEPLLSVLDKRPFI